MVDVYQRYRDSFFLKKPKNILPKERLVENFDVKQKSRPIGQKNPTRPVDTKEDLLRDFDVTIVAEKILMRQKFAPAMEQNESSGGGGDIECENSNAYLKELYPINSFSTEFSTDSIGIKLETYNGTIVFTRPDGLVSCVKSTDDSIALFILLQDILYSQFEFEAIGTFTSLSSVFAGGVFSNINTTFSYWPIMYSTLNNEPIGPISSVSDITVVDLFTPSSTIFLF